MTRHPFAGTPFQEWLFQQWRESGKSQAQFAKHIGVSQGGLSQYLSGVRLPERAKVWEIAAALNVEESYVEELIRESRVLSNGQADESIKQEVIAVLRQAGATDQEIADLAEIWPDLSREARREVIRHAQGLAALERQRRSAS